jgi:hypothetical protein
MSTVGLHLHLCSIFWIFGNINFCIDTILYRLFFVPLRMLWHIHVNLNLLWRKTDGGKGETLKCLQGLIESYREAMLVGSSWSVG